MHKAVCFLGHVPQEIWLYKTWMTTQKQLIKKVLVAVKAHVAVKSFKFHKSSHISEVYMKMKSGSCHKGASLLLSNDSKTRSQDSRTVVIMLLWFQIQGVYFQANYNVPGGRISPSVSEADLRNPTESLKLDVSMQILAFFFKFTKHLLGLQICFTHSILAKLPWIFVCCPKKGS